MTATHPNGAHGGGRPEKASLIALGICGMVGIGLGVGTVGFLTARDRPAADREGPELPQAIVDFHETKPTLGTLRILDRAWHCVPTNMDTYTCDARYTVQWGGTQPTIYYRSTFTSTGKLLSTYRTNPDGTRYQEPQRQIPQQPANPHPYPGGSTCQFYPNARGC